MSVGYPKPTKRKLRVYAFDPAASVRLETAIINDFVIELPWEKLWEDPVALGPINEYLEVIDIDPGSGLAYEPVDLNAPELLAQNGLPPSEGCPQFHQQMVFAVAMKTIRNFEHALGRPVFWSIPDGHPKEQGYGDFIKRLRIYPHAMRKANAYFSPKIGALLFGYFRSKPTEAVAEGEWTFTCLSQDIIAHETTHAILHGMRRRNIEPANQDSLAFHEAFADIIALLLHFDMHEVVKHELARNGGQLRSAKLLTGLASQFGHATGRNGPLRLALERLATEADSVGPVGTLANVHEPHKRGQFLVAAVFDAFVTIYERRTSDLFRIANTASGSSELPDRLIARLAKEAASAAKSMMNICVRALDYLPPVSADFGEYLRAMITADSDLVPDDPLKYRVAIAESFRKRGITVPGCISYAPESLCWEPPDLSPFRAVFERDGTDRNSDDPDMLFADALRNMTFFARLNDGSDAAPLPPAEPDATMTDKRREDRARLGRLIGDSPYLGSNFSDRNLREEAMRVVLRNQLAFHQWLAQCSPTLEQEEMWEDLLGIRTLPLGIRRASKSAEDEERQLRRQPFSISHRQIPAKEWLKSTGCGDWWKIDASILRIPKFEVHSVRIARRNGPDGNELFQLVAQVTQKRFGYFDPDEQEGADSDENAIVDGSRPDFWFRGGATLIVDLRDGRVQHIIRKRIDKNKRLRKQRNHLVTDSMALALAGAETGRDNGGGKLTMADISISEPFAFMHEDME